MGFTKEQGWVADIDLILDKHYTPGRGGHPIDGVISHHNAGQLTAEQIFGTWQTRQASAHYQVEHDNKRTSQHVWDADTAWHAGNWLANQTKIGIEHANAVIGAPWTVSDLTIDGGAQIGAAILTHLDLASPQWMVNWFPHNYFQATACPGGILTRVEYLMTRARLHYSIFTGSDPTPTQPAANTHTVTLGETLYGIAARYGIDWKDLAGDNNIAAPYLIYPGEQLSIGWSSATADLPRTPDGRTFDQVVTEVIAGQWGNGQDRVDRLRSAGWDYAEVQKEVNYRLQGTSAPATKSATELAREVIQGLWGNGQDRADRLYAAGYSYAAVQAEVNRILG